MKVSKIEKDEYYSVNNTKFYTISTTIFQKLRVENKTSQTLVWNFPHFFSTSYPSLFKMLVYFKDSLLLYVDKY